MIKKKKKPRTKYPQIGKFQFLTTHFILPVLFFILWNNPNSIIFFTETIHWSYQLSIVSLSDVLSSRFIKFNFLSLQMFHFFYPPLCPLFLRRQDTCLINHHSGLTYWQLCVCAYVGKYNWRKIKQWSLLKLIQFN